MQLVCRSKGNGVEDVSIALQIWDQSIHLYSVQLLTNQLVQIAITVFVSLRVLSISLKKLKVSNSEMDLIYSIVLRFEFNCDSKLNIHFSFIAGCVSDFDHLPSIEEVCQNLDKKQQLITLFAENYSPINCRSSLEGVFHFDYQVHNFS